MLRHICWRIHLMIAFSLYCRNGQEDFEKQITIRAGSSVKAIQDFAEAAAITAHPHSHYSPSLEATSHGLHAEAGRPLAMEPQLVHKVCNKWSFLGFSRARDWHTPCYELPSGKTYSHFRFYLFDHVSIISHIYLNQE